MMQRGFTLVEMLVAVGIFVVAMAAVSGVVVTSYQTYGHSIRQSQVIDEARHGIETMVREIREARTAENGSYPIEKAADKEFVFYSDVDNDGDVERVRYFLGSVVSGSDTKDCVSFVDGGSCSVSFSNFATGIVESADVDISVEGDMGWNNVEYAATTADSNTLGDVCRTGCSDCAGNWQGTTNFDVTTYAADNSITFVADSTAWVNDFCDWQQQNHSIKAQFVFNWEENQPSGDGEFKKGVIEPVGQPATYPTANETVTTLSKFVHNTPPIFQYFDDTGALITETPARLADTRLMRLYLEVDVDPNEDPPAFQLESSVQLRNLSDILLTP